MKGNVFAAVEKNIRAPASPESVAAEILHAAPSAP